MSDDDDKPKLVSSRDKTKFLGFLECKPQPNVFTLDETIEELSKLTLHDIHIAKVIKSAIHHLGQYDQLDNITRSFVGEWSKWND